MNKNLYLAKALLNFLEKRPNGILFISTEPETLTILNNFWPTLLPGLTKQEIAEGFLSLERQGAIKYESRKDAYQGNYEQIKDFEVVPLRDKLKQFISFAENDIFGFKLSDEQYCVDLIETLKTLLMYSNTITNLETINVTDFHQPNAYDILQKIADFSGAIKIDETIKIELEDIKGKDVDIYGGKLVPSILHINNGQKIQKILNETIQKIKEVYGYGVNTVLQNKGQLEWRCVKCSRFLGTYKSAKEIMELLDSFSSGKYRACINCRTKNFFSISTDGNVCFETVDK